MISNIKKTLWFIGILLFISSCGKKVQTLTSDINQVKSFESLSACKEIKIPQDVDLNGRFIYYFPQCASIKMPDGSESLGATINLVKALGPTQIENLTTFLKIDPPNRRGDIKDDYPLIKSALTFNERGIFQNDRIDPVLYEERFGPFQKFQKDLIPYFFGKLILDLNEKGKLKNLINNVKPFFDRINFSNLQAFLRASMENRELVESSMDGLVEFLSNKKLYEAAKGILTMEKTYPIENSQGEDCLKDWLDPKLKGTLDPCDFKKHKQNTRGEDVISLSDQRIEGFLSSLDSDQKEKFFNLMANLLKKFVSLDNDKRNDILIRLSEGGIEGYYHQDGPIRNLLGLLEFLMGNKDDASTLKVKDLDLILTAIENSLLEGGPIILSPMYQKQAQGKIQEKIVNLIYEGGPILGCPNLSLKGFKDVDIDNREEVLRTIYAFFLPQSQCELGPTPIASFVLSTFKKELELTEECFVERDGYVLEKPCLPKAIIPEIHQKFKEIDWSAAQNTDEIEPTLFKNFILHTLNETKKGLSDDSYFLHWANFAHGEKSPESIDTLIDLITETLEVTPKLVAYIDDIMDDRAVYNEAFSQVINQEKFSELKKTYKNLFRKNFLENILSYQVDQLNAQVEEFQDLFNRDERSDQKIFKLFSGTYNKGPYEQFFKKELNFEKLTNKLPSIPRDTIRVREVLGRQKMDGVLFHNERIDNADLKPSFDYLGEGIRSVEASYNDTGENEQTFDKLNFGTSVFGLQDVFGDFLRLKPILVDNNLFTGINISGNEADEYVAWLKDVFYPGFIENFKENYGDYEFKGLEEFNKDFFEVTPYSANEARQISLFYSSHYIFAKAALPADKTTFEFDFKRDKKKPMVTFNMLELYEDHEKRWGSYLNNFPDAFTWNSNEHQKFNDLVSQVLGNVTDVEYTSLPWAKLPIDKVGRRGLDESAFSEKELNVIKTFSALHLFTTNRVKQFVPLLGVAEECKINRSIIKCPLKFIDKVNAEAVIVKSRMESLKEYAQSAFRGQLCTLFNKEYFSADFVRNLSERLKVDIGLADLMTQCMGIDNLFNEKSDRIPAIVSQVILKDVLNMGKNPRLKPSLGSLSAQIRYYKMNNEKYAQKKMQLKELLKARGPFGPRLLASSIHRLNDNRGYITIFPGMINYYENFLYSAVKKSGGNINLSKDWYGAEIKANEPAELGILQRLVEDKIFPIYRNFDKEKPLFLYIFTVLKSLDQKELKSIAGLISYPHEIEALNNTIETLPLLLRYFYNLNPTPEFWEQPGARILKNLLRIENMKALVDLLNGFSTQEITDGLLVIHEELLKLGEPEDIYKNLLTAHKFLKSMLLSEGVSTNKGTVLSLEKNVESLLSESGKLKDIRRLNKILNFLNTDDLIDFKGIKRKAAINEINGIIRFGIEDSYKLFSLYQDHFNETKDNQVPNYFGQMISGLIRPYSIDKENSIVSMKSFASLLSDPNLGTWNNLYSKILFEEKYQNQYLPLLSAVYKIDNQIFINALDESSILVPTSYNMLSLVFKNIIWSPDSSEDTKFSLGALLRFSDPNNKILEYSTDLMKTWLNQKDLMQLDIMNSLKLK